MIIDLEIEREARSIIKFMDAGDLNIERLKLEADLNGNSTRPFSDYRELIEERLAVVKRGLELLSKR